MLSFSSVEDVIFFHGVNVIILKAWMLSFSSVGDVIIFGFLDAIFLIVEDVIIFQMLSFFGVEDVTIFHYVNVMKTINDNINDNTKYVQGKMIT
jgi:hypothetical protein